MRLKEFRIKNFRSYKDEVTVKFNDLTVFVGRNDIGKSSILEAMDIFFNDKNAINQLEMGDINKSALQAGDNETVLTAIFDDLPESILIDDTVNTTLSDEKLLDTNGTLTVVKRFQGTPKAKIYIKANHPSNPECNNLLLLKLNDLKRKAEGLECENRTKKSLLRKAIWEHFADNLQSTESEIDTSGEGLKDIWEKLDKYMPIYSLFQSDRSNSDKDKEAQDPLKEAVKEILSEEDVKNKLQEVANYVKGKLETVTNATLSKIEEMNPEIAHALNPSIPPVETLKWTDVFKNVSITSDDEIAINKRGSGVKRLILLNFFRAKAERMMNDTNHSSIIYAIEEPETSQHIHHQRLLIDSFKTISSSPNSQIVLTTHSSHIVKMMKSENLRLISEIGDTKTITNVESYCLPQLSLNEVNYVAFGEYSEIYHDELFGYLQSKAIEEDYNNGREANFDNWLVSKGCVKSKTWVRELADGSTRSNNYTLQTYIRNFIHHPENQHNEKYGFEELKSSIEKMRLIASAI